MFEVEEVRGETVELLGRLERLTAAVEQAEREGRQETAPATQANSCSRILIFTHPGYRIQKQEQKRGVEKICCHTFFVVTNLTKLQII